jgi:putative colanic acid biosynthesis UDP-glucose lipid carrier transferase
LAALRGLLPPLVAATTLVACAQLLNVKFTSSYVALATIAALLCWIFMSTDLRNRNVVLANGLTVAGQVCFAWLAVIGLLLLLAYATKASDSFSRRALFLWFLLTPPILVAALMVLRQWTRMALVSSSSARNAVIVGANTMSLKLARLIDERPELSLKLKCVFAPVDHECVSNGRFEVRRDLADVRGYVNKHRVDVVFVALPIETPETQAVLGDLRDTTSSVYFLPDISIVDLIQARSDDIEGIPVIALCESPFRGVSGLLKRATDIAFASVMLALLLPVMLIIGVAIKLDSPGSILFRQHRYGLQGERIAVYKFRTMKVTENGARIVQAKRSDPRVTAVGAFLRRTSLDELPQLFNVLQGSMSLVGPRPHAVAHNEQYRKVVAGYMIRHKVVPGITGLAQINGCRGETATVEEMRRRVEYDLEYLRSWCWLLDLKIMLKTCALLFRDKHAY